MKFPLVNTGRRFFFFTFVVEGRLPVLSRLERGQKRPILLPAGERIVEIWRQLHKIEPHFTASDFVIMPDHVHLLLIVNSEGEFRFNPLVFAHWFMDVTTDGGLRPPNPLLPPTDWCSYYQAGNGGSGAEPPSIVAPPSFVWSRDYWVDISFDGRQLAAIRRYIKMNPARYFWKLDNPDMFRIRENIRHPVLEAGLPWSAMGDLTILASPFLYLVRLTMRKTALELEDEIAAHIEHARHGWTPVCGFISPGEREFERRLKNLPYSRWIKTVPYGLPERYDPSVEDAHWIAEYRQLVLSSFTRAEIPPFQIKRKECLLMNERNLKMEELAGKNAGKNTK